MSSLQLCKHTVSFIIIHYLKVYEERAHDVHVCRGRNSTTGASHTSFLLPYIRQWWKSRLAPLKSQHIVDADLEPMGLQLHSAGCPCAFFQTSDLLSPPLRSSQLLLPVPFSYSQTWRRVTPTNTCQGRCALLAAPFVKLRNWDKTEWFPSGYWLITILVACLLCCLFPFQKQQDTFSRFC